jgi:hypothetical protein
VQGDPANFSFQEPVMIHRVAVAIVLVALLLAVGCESTEVAIAPDLVPANVMAGFKKQFPDATIMEVKKEIYNDGLVHYEFEFKGKDGKKQEVEFNADGGMLDEH